MKARIFKAFALLLWLGLWQTGCYPDKFDPEGDEVGPIATLDFSNPSVEFKAEAESRTVMVTTNYKTYRVDVPEEAATWCHVTSEGMTLTIAVQPGTLGDNIRDRGKGEQGVDEDGFRVPSGHIAASEIQFLAIDFQTKGSREGRSIDKYQSGRVDVQRGGGRCRLVRGYPGRG